MHRPRFSLRAMLLGTAFVAAACATLRFPNGWLASAWWLLTVSVLLFAIVAAALLGQRRRAFWMGFAICGWGYFCLTLFPSPIFGTVASRLLTTRALASGYHALNPKTGWSNGELANNPLLPQVGGGGLGGQGAGNGANFSGGGFFYQPPVDSSEDRLVLDQESDRFGSAPGERDASDATESAEEMEMLVIGSGVNSNAGLSGSIALTPATAARFNMEEFVRLGNLLWTLLFAFYGGIAGRWLFDTRDGLAGG